MNRHRCNKLATWLNSLQRRVMCNTLSGSLPLYIVTEFPKSGGTWFGQMLAEYLKIPFPRNTRPMIQSCVMHGHYRYSPLMKNVFCIIRDGRDVMVSAYYHVLFENERNSPSQVATNRRRLRFDDYEDIRTNLPDFIEYMFTSASRGPTRFTWDQFVGSWCNRPVPVVRYEDLLVRTADVMSGSIAQVTGLEPDRSRLDSIAHKYSFQALAKRKPGAENPNSFLRKGIAGDWKNRFTRRAREIFDYYAGDVLVDLGYEDNRSWASSPRSPGRGREPGRQPGRTAVPQLTRNSSQ